MAQEIFSNSEQSVQIKESVNGRDVYIVQTGRGGPQADSDLLEVLTMIHTAKINSARSVTVVLPNYPCGRADKVDKPRTPIMARLVADLLTTAGADHVVTMDLHAGQIQGEIEPGLALGYKAAYNRFFRAWNPLILMP